MKFNYGSKQHLLKFHNNDEYYWTVGDKKNPAILLLCGYTGTHSDLLLLAHDLEDSHYVIIPDLPGWGKSSTLKQRETLSYYASFLKEIIAVESLPKVTVIGHCMGATLGMEFAYQNPHITSRLICVSIPYGEGVFAHSLLAHLAVWSEKVPPFLRPALFLWRNRIVSFLLSFYTNKFRTMHKNYRVAVENLLKRRYQNEKTIEENWVSLMKYDYRNKVASSIPLHFIHGAKDVLITPKQIEKLHMLYPHATVDIIEQAGHLPPVETPKSLAKVVLHYLN